MHFLSQLLPLALMGLGMVSAIPADQHKHPKSTLTVLGIEKWPHTVTETETVTVRHTDVHTNTVVMKATVTTTPAPSTQTVDHSTTIDHTKTEKPVTTITTTTTQNIYTLYIPPSAAPSPPPQALP